MMKVTLLCLAVMIPAGPCQGPASLFSAVADDNITFVAELDPAQTAPSAPPGSRIQRTMTLLSTSTPDQRNRVKILFYGQSIIAQNWWKGIVADLRERFPHADILAENPSIGGFMSDLLKDTMHADCYPANADLICFHDYGRDPAELEEMFAGMRRLTSAEVMAFTHHLAAEKAWEKAQDRESDLIRKLSAKHGFELVDIREGWRNHLKTSGMSEKQFLKDVVHLGPDGEALWLKLTLPHFQVLPDAKPYWREWVKVYLPSGQPFAPDSKREYPGESESLRKPLKLAFEGSRVDVLAVPSQEKKPGTARILIDGKPPSAHRELYYATRSTTAPNFFHPMLRRAEVGTDPVVEKWTLTFSGISATGEDFFYDVQGSVTGPDGRGNAKEKFVSKSGRLIIEPRWFMIPALVKGPSKGKPYPDGTTCTLEVRPNFLDVWKPSVAPPAGTEKVPTSNGFGPVLAAPRTPASEVRHTLASGLSNGPHVLEILPNDDGDLPLRSIVVHRPPRID